MASLERRAGKDRSFWDIAREGSELVVRQGSVVRKAFKTPELAQQELEKLVTAKRAEGYATADRQSAKSLKTATTAKASGLAGLNETDRAVAEKFLAHLDAAYEKGCFPFPLHERMDYAAMRVHAYRGKAGFALLVEMLVFDREVHRIERSLGMCNMVFVFYSDGRRLAWSPRTLPLPVASATNEPSASLTEGCAINPEAKTLLLRRKRVAITHDPKVYRSHKIAASTPPSLPDLLRLLVETQRNDLFSSDVERAKLMRGMYKLLRVDAWCYRNVAPSKLEAMQMLAAVLATKDVIHWAPKDKPNTDWRTIGR